MAKLFLFFILAPFAFLQAENIVAVVGDSILQGYPEGHEFSWMSFLREDPECEGLVFKGCFDEASPKNDGTFRAAYKYLDRLIASQQIPDLYIIALGFHEIAKQIPSKKSYSDLQKVINTCKPYGTKILLCNCEYDQSNFLRSRYSPEQIWTLKKIVNSMQNYHENVVLFEYLDEDLFNNPELNVDGIHLNKKGQQILAKKMKNLIFAHLIKFSQR